MTGPAPHVVQPPPADDPQTSAAARIIEAAATYEVATAALAVLLKPARIGADAIAAALRLSGRRTNHQPRQRGIGSLAKRAARDELYYRAAYVLRAAARTQASLNSGMSLRQAIGAERRYWEQHEKMRRTRLEAVKRDLINAQWFGPILGWYLNPLLNNEAECIAANGHNYEAELGTLIGRPGTVHGGCGCTSGPPHEGAGWVDEAVAGVIVMGKPRPLRIPRKRRAA